MKREYSKAAFDLPGVTINDATLEHHDDDLEGGIQNEDIANGSDSLVQLCS